VEYAVTKFDPHATYPRPPDDAPPSVPQMPRSTFPPKENVGIYIVQAIRDTLFTAMLLAAIMWGAHWHLVDNQLFAVVIVCLIVGTFALRSPGAKFDMQTVLKLLGR
jgi:hypothetical protein